MAPPPGGLRWFGMDRLLELTSRAERTHFWFRGFRRFVTPWLAEAARHRTALRLLDCGCGTGVNLPLLARHGTAYGFDLTARGLEFARARGEPRVARASIDAMPFPDGVFDVVTSFDVLYALPDDVEAQALREMARVLKPGGAALVTVAAFESLRGGHGALSQEVRRYTRATLASRFARAGFDVERTSYTHATLFPLLFAVRAVQRRRAGRSPDVNEAEIAVPMAPVNAALSAALAVESWVLPRMNLPFGSSAIALARKPA
ncbi:MAG: class I SAM-dependent methyltransferase [Vicinamibacterales bacterium]